jgi:hypothetical protein
MASLSDPATVGELRAFIRDIPDDAPLSVYSGSVECETSFFLHYQDGTEEGMDAEGLVINTEN